MFDPLIFNFDFTLKEKFLRSLAIIFTFAVIITIIFYNFSFSTVILLLPLIYILFLLFPRSGYISLLEIESGTLKYLIYHKTSLVRKIIKPIEKTIPLLTLERLEIIHKGIFTRSGEIIFYLKPKKIKFHFRTVVLRDNDLQELQIFDHLMHLKRTSINANLVWLAENFSYDYDIDEMSMDFNEDINYLILVNIVIFIIFLIQFFTYISF